MPDQDILEPDTERPGEEFVEFLERRGSNFAGDTTWVDEDVAHANDFFRIVPEKERDAIRREAKIEGAGDEPQEFVDVLRPVNPHGNQPGDRAWFAQSVAEDLRAMHPPAVSDPIKVKGVDPDSEKAKEAQQREREDELDQLDYRDDGDGLFGLAQTVASEVDEQPDGRGTDALKSFLLDHWKAYLAVTSEDDE